MIYQIKDNYYVKVGNKFVKLSFSMNNGELVMTPINSEKIENNPNLIVRATTFENEKSKIEESLKNNKKSFEKDKLFDRSFGKGKSLN